MTLHAVFTRNQNEVTTGELFQWDTGQQLCIEGLTDIDENTEVHFANNRMRQAIVKAGTYENNILTVEIPNEFLQSGGVIHGKAWVYVTESETVGQTIKTINIPIVPRTRPNDYVSPADPDSKGIVEQALEILRDGTKVSYITSATVNNATETGKVYYTTTDKALIIPVSAEFSQAQFRSRSSTSVDFPAWGTFDQIGWKRSDIDGWIEAAIESLEPEYIFVTEIPSNADHSKKYVLPDGYIWEWREGTPGTTYNAANLANINKTAVTGSSSTTLAAKNGVITSDLIPWDSSWTVVEPPGNNSTIAISGVSALAPVQYNSYGGALFVYYYRSDGSYIEARRPSTLQNVEYSDDQSIPIGTGQSYSFQLADSELYNLSNIGYIRIVLGISTSAITTQDVANLVINIPAYDVAGTSGGWINTGVKHPDYDSGLPDGGTAGQVLTKTADSTAWQDVNFSKALDVSSGQILYAVGDSITYGYGIGGNEYSWVKHVIQHNGYDAVNSRNLGQNGLGFCTNSTSNRDTDGVLVWYGILFRQNPN